MMSAAAATVFGISDSSALNALSESSRACIERLRDHDGHNHDPSAGPPNE